MSSRKAVIISVALIIAVGTTYATQVLMAPQNVAPGAPAPVAPQKTTDILVAARDLPAGTLLKAEDMKWQTWPENKDALGLVTKDKGKPEDYAGAVVRQGLHLGEPVMAGRVVRKQEQGFMAAVLNPGMRAMAVSITPVAGVAGFVFPGDRVDVIVAHEIGAKNEAQGLSSRKVSETVLRDVRVLALDQRANDQETDPKIAQTATLEVNPKQAEALALASQIGQVILSLRSIAGDEVETAGIQIDQALAGALPRKSADNLTWDSDVSQVLPAPANRRGTVQRIQIMRGNEMTETVFELPQ